MGHHTPFRDWFPILRGDGYGYALFIRQQARSDRQLAETLRLDCAPQEEPAARYRDGQIWWRGSGEQWFWQGLDSAERLRDLFAAEPNPYARPLARDLTDAINSYRENHP